MRRLVSAVYFIRLAALSCCHIKLLLKMSKQYGLILSGQQKKTAASPQRAAITKPSVFDESSTDSNDEKLPQLKPKASMGPSLMERRIARNMQEKALAEDPTVFQYDELYDEMADSKREQDNVANNSKEARKPKYIGRLMKYAEQRKLENELRMERQVQKEREAEGEMYKDKETYVTAAYRKKLEEIRKMEEKEKRDEYLEQIGDVTKQKDLDGFYRHLYEQKLGSDKIVKKSTLEPKTSSPGGISVSPTGADESSEEIAYKPIKSLKSTKQRAYRKRNASDDDESVPETENNVSTQEPATKKVHIQNNIDADSDFSIDDSSSDEEDHIEKPETKPKDVQKPPQDGLSTVNPATIALRLNTVKSADKELAQETEEKEVIKEEIVTEEKEVKPKIDKSAIWRKRTVGEVYDAAVKRYFERKAMRYA